MSNCREAGREKDKEGGGPKWPAFATWASSRRECQLGVWGMLPQEAKAAFEQVLVSISKEVTSHWTYDAGESSFPTGLTAQARPRPPGPPSESDYKTANQK